MRAKDHRDQLERRIADAFQQGSGDLPIAVGKYDPDTGCHVFRITYVPASLPVLLQDVQLTMGDIAHNLRAALDHLAYQLALAEARRANVRLSADELGRIYFPIHTRGIGGRPNVGWQNREQTYLARFGAANLAVIKRYQPYRRWTRRTDSWSGRYQHQLTLLRDLSNRDKHRLLPVIAAIPNSFRWYTPPGVLLDFWSHDCASPLADRVKLGAEVMRQRFVGPGTAEVDVRAEVPPLISLPKRGDVVGEMDRVAAFVVRIVREFGPEP